MKLNEKAVIEKIGEEEFYKCANIWDMEKCPFTDEFYQQIKSGNRISFVYKLNGEFIGQGDLVLDKEGYTVPDKRIYLSRLIVKKEYRKQGIGSLITAFLIDKAKELGYSEISLGVDCCNENALRLYKKAGFEVYAKDKDEYGDFYKMLKKLQEKAK